MEDSEEISDIEPETEIQSPRLQRYGNIIENTEYESNRKSFKKNRQQKIWQKTLVEPIADFSKPYADDDIVFTCEAYDSEILTEPIETLYKVPIPNIFYCNKYVMTKASAVIDMIYGNRKLSLNSPPNEKQEKPEQQHESEPYVLKDICPSLFQLMLEFVVFPSKSVNRRPELLQTWLSIQGVQGLLRLLECMEQYGFYDAISAVDQCISLFNDAAKPETKSQGITLGFVDSPAEKMKSWFDFFLILDRFDMKAMLTKHIKRFVNIFIKQFPTFTNSFDGESHKIINSRWLYTFDKQDKSNRYLQPMISVADNVVEHEHWIYGVDFEESRHILPFSLSNHLISALFIAAVNQSQEMNSHTSFGQVTDFFFF